MKTRVVVAGMGVITPIGDDTESSWQGPKDRTVGIGPVTYFDTTSYKCRLAAEVKGLDPEQYMDAKAARRMEAFPQFAAAASKEALEQSGIDIEKGDLYQVGVCVGSDIGSFQAMEKDVERLNKKEPSRVNPFLVPLMISNIAADDVIIQFGLKGKRFNVVITYTTGTHSIGEMFRPTQYGEANVVVTNGAETSIIPIGIAGFTSLTVLNTTKDASRASIPFDEDRNGFVTGEGAGVIVLGSLEHAKAGGTSILAEVVGYDTICDAFHITFPAEDGSGATRAMKDAMKDVGMAAEDIDYVDAHGTSTHHNDLLETKAIRLALGDHAEKVKTNPTKSMIGHLLGAAGGVKFITCVKSIQDGFVHATAGPEEPGEGCDLDYTMDDGVSMNVDVAISNSLGFGGYNASLIAEKFNE